jgi:hypothetical protein
MHLDVEVIELSTNKQHHPPFTMYLQFSSCTTAHCAHGLSLNASDTTASKTASGADIKTNSSCIKDQCGTRHHDDFRHRHRRLCSPSTEAPPAASSVQETWSREYQATTNFNTHQNH